MTSSSDQNRPLGSGYVLHEQIGSGATGFVWRASRIELSEDVAVKTLRPDLSSDADLVSQFLVQRRALVGIDHPNLVRVRDLVAEGETLAIVMDLAPGMDLRRRLSTVGTFRAGEAVEICSQLLDGLGAVHSHGIVHRDVKPENLLIEERQGRPPHARLTDFGIARVIDAPTLTRHTGMIGTPLYMAPELATDQPPTAAADQYSTGVLFYELLAGRPPFLAEHPLGLLAQHQSQQPGQPEEIPSPLWDVIATMMAKDPGDRFESVDEAARAMRAAAGQMSREELAARAPTSAGAIDTEHPTRMKTLAADEELPEHGTAADAGSGFTDLLWLRVFGIAGIAVVCGVLAFLLIPGDGTVVIEDPPLPPELPVDPTPPEEDVAVGPSDAGDVPDGPSGDGEVSVDPPGEEDVQVELAGGDDDAGDPPPEQEVAVEPVRSTDGRPILCSDHDGEDVTTSSPESTGYRVVEFCTIDVPEPGRILIIASAIAAKSSEDLGIATNNPDYTGAIKLFKDDSEDPVIDQISFSTRSFQVDGTAQLVPVVSTAAIDVEEGSINVGLLVRRVDGGQPVLRDPSVTAIYVPEGATDVQLCSQTRGELYQTSRTTIGGSRDTLVGECSLSTDRPGSVLLVASAEAVLDAGAPYEGRITIRDTDSALDIDPTGHQFNVRSDGSPDGIPTPVAIVDGRELSPSDLTYLGLFAFKIADRGPGDLRLNAAHVAALWVAEDSEHVDLCVNSRSQFLESEDDAVGREVSSCTVTLPAGGRAVGVGTGAVQVIRGGFVDVELGLTTASRPDPNTTRHASTYRITAAGEESADLILAYNAMYGVDGGDTTFDLHLRSSGELRLIDSSLIVLAVTDSDTE